MIQQNRVRNIHVVYLTVTNSYESSRSHKIDITKSNQTGNTLGEKVAGKADREGKGQEK